MRITLVYPGIAMIGFDSLGGNCHDTISINLGMAYLSSYIKKNSSHTVDLIDLRDISGWDSFESQLEKRNPDIVGIYCNTVSYDFSLKCAEIAKSQERIVIMGGPYPTLYPHLLIDSGFVDTVISGEGEVSFLNAINDIAAGIQIDKVIQGERIDNLDDIPFPDREIYNMDRILDSPGIFPYPNRYIGVIASRGCRYNCSFCQPLERTIFGHKVRMRSVANIIREVEEIIEKYNAKFIMFECDTLTTEKEWALSLCSQMKRLGIKWGAQSRVDTIDSELANAMSDAGCMVLFLGFESGSPRILEFLRKGIKPQHSIKAANVCRDNKILIFANYMLGIPTETKDDLDMTYQMIKNIKPELHSPSYFAPIHGSYLYDYCRDRDLIKITSCEGFVRNPINEKLKGVDYKLLERYREYLTRYRKEWWQESYFFKYVISRWLFLIRRGYLKTFVIEIVTYTSLLMIPALFLKKLVKNSRIDK